MLFTKCNILCQNFSLFISLYLLITFYVDNLLATFYKYVKLRLQL